MHLYQDVYFDLALERNKQDIDENNLTKMQMSNLNW
jgi:hypothetical protein